MESKKEIGTQYGCKITIDATQTKEELKELEEQIDIVTKKYKEFKKLSRTGSLAKNVNIFLAYISSIIWLFKGEIIHATFCLILILVIGQAYKGDK